ncbi:ABC transporter G family member 6-like protein [Carex littledalei]|uniref:ABC transporter G family member 5 n=1 Tax=Carex littledalei TaxID=544730 RepID=A0A833RIA7_9POAL|nr:ABC transporter G family member 6-like protein [Carex littledalei]
MELQHNPNSSHLVVDVVSPSAHQTRSSNVGIDRPPMFVLSFTDITYQVHKTKKLSFSSLVKCDNGHSRKTLLDSVSDVAREGEIFAILGASGSGKSTLIDALANRIAGKSLQGSITLNGDILESRLLKVLSAYVMQDDLLYPMLTVKETLMYAAEFRLPRSMPKEKKNKRVEELIKQLGLENATNTIIGDEGHRGVSGGERRRVSIGMDIVHDPILLFLDEPTSGLDSTSAYMVVDVLKKIAIRGSIVILSIHQPSYRILNLLDRLLFLSRGQTVFYGPPRSLSMYFSEFGRPIPDNENPTEFALDLVREREMTDFGAKDFVDFNRSWRRQHQDLFPSDRGDIPHIPLEQAIAASFASGRLVSSTNNTANASVASVRKFTNPFWIEMGVLTKRSFTNTNRMPELYMIRLGAVLITGIILATIYWRLDNTPKGVQERLGFFAIGMSTMFYTCADALPVFMQERYIYMRETAHNAYRKSSFVLSNAIVSFPPLVFLSIGFALTTFFAVGLDGGMFGFLFYTAIILASFWAGSGFITFLSGIVSHIIVGYTTAIAILSYYLLFSGFFINRDRIPDYWIWFHYISLVKYPFQAVLQNEFSDPNKCFVRGTQMFDNTPIEAFNESTKVEVLASISSSLGLNLTKATCITTGPDILSRNSIDDLSKWNSLWVTVAWGFFYRFLFYIVLLMRSKNKRK